MGRMKINSNDAQWLQEHYPRLHIKNGDTITGILRFRAERKDKRKRPMTRHPEVAIWHLPPKTATGRLYIEDRYEIEGYFDEDLNPHFKETGSRLAVYAKKIGKQMIDLHLFSGTNEFCLGHPVFLAEMKEDSSIEKFFEGLLIPYLYYLSYREKFNEEPWPGLKHSKIGLLEELGSIGSKHKLKGQSLIEAVQINLPREYRKIHWYIQSGLAMKRNDKCFCDSGKKVKDCCGDLAMKGFNNLLKAIKASQN